MNKPAGKPAAATPIDRFTAIVGEKYSLREASAMAPFLTEQRDLYHGCAAAVLRPGSTEEVAAIVKLAQETRTPIVPQGGNTGLVGAQTPFDERAIVISTQRLDKIREIDVAANTMTCESGVVLQRAQEAAAAKERFFPLSLGAEGSCTIGGNLSTNAGGLQALSYGVARDLVLGLEVVLADGRIWRGLRKLKKDNTGYDLRHLFVGAEGTLGIITAAVLKLFPAPRTVETAVVGLASPKDALALLMLAQSRAGNMVTTFELMQRISIEYTAKHLPGARDPLAKPYPWYVLIELTSPMQQDLRAALEDLLAEGTRRGIVGDAVLGSSEAQRLAFRKLRAGVAELQKTLGAGVKHDISVPVSAVPAFIEQAEAALAKLIPGGKPVAFGHIGDGNIHYNFAQPEGADPQKFLARWDEVNAVVYEIVMRLGGSISAEHGIGVMKRKLLPGVKDPVELDLMRAIKRTLDPNGILNPGKVL